MKSPVHPSIISAFAKPGIHIWGIRVLTIMLAGGVLLWHSQRTAEVPDPPAPELLALSDVPGISPLALAARGKHYEITEPVAYHRQQGLALFEVDILDPVLAESGICFSGDGESFNGFVGELVFLKANAGTFHLGTAVQGAGEGITTLVEGLWHVARHPMETAEGVADAAAALKDYSQEVAKGQADPTDDFKDLVEACYLNTVSEITAEAGFSYQEAVTDEARSMAGTMATWKLSARAATELALVLAPAAHLKKIKLVKDLSRGATVSARVGESSQTLRGYHALLARASLFSQGPKITRSFSRLTQFGRAESALAAHNLRHLCANTRLATLRPRSITSRHHKMMHELHKLDQQGANPATVLKEILESKVQGEFYYHPELARQQLLANYNNAKFLGLFDDAENLEKLRHGRAPVIRKGPHIGEIVEVDHIIPVTHAPELGSNLANVRLLARSVNQTRRASLDSDALSLIQKLSSAGWRPTPDLSTRITAE